MVWFASPIKWGPTLKIGSAHSPLCQWKGGWTCKFTKMMLGRHRRALWEPLDDTGLRRWMLNAVTRWKVESSLAIARHPLVPPAYGHMHACMILYGHEADSPLLEGRPTQEVAGTVRKDRRSGRRTHPQSD